MTDFPSGVNAPAAPNYASPLLDFSPAGQIGNDYYKGQNEQLALKAKTAFRNGIPKTPDGQTDWSGAASKLIELGDFGGASQIGNLGFQQGSIEQMRTNPEITGKPAPAAAPSAGGRQSAVKPFDDRPARPNNSDGFDPPDSSASSAPAGARVAQGGNTASDAPQPGTNLAPSVKAEIDRRGSNGDFETRKRNLGKLMMSPFPGVKDYAGKLLDSLLKEQEQTPMEKEVDPARGNAYGRKVQTDVSGKNQELTPEEKNVNPGRGNAAQRAEDIKVGGANRTMTPEAKNTQPAPGVSPAQAAEDIKTSGSIRAKAGEGSVANFEKEYRGLQVAAQTAYHATDKAKLAMNLTLQPGFYSGPFQPTTQMYQQVKAALGSDPGTGMPQEVFQKVATDMLTEQIKSLGQSGVGRVLMVEVQNMKNSIASLGVTAASNRALLDITQRVGAQSQQLGAISREIAASNMPPEQKEVALHQAADKFYAEHPLFTEAERADPRIIGAPDAPPQIKTPDQARAWARGAGLPSGYPIKWNGKIVAVP